MRTGISGSWSGQFRCAVIGLTLVALLGPYPEEIRADQDHPALDTLFERLQKAGSQAEGERLTERIWVLWREIE